MDKILIIEDDPDIAAIERDYLELSGCAVTICANGTDGQRAALEGAFDLILLDLMLPGTDGFSICRAVRAQKDIPILMVTTLPQNLAHDARQGRRQDPRPRLRRGRLHRKALLAERPRRAREGEPRASAAAADGLGRGVPAAKGQ